MQLEHFAMHVITGWHRQVVRRAARTITRYIVYT